MIPTFINPAAGNAAEVDGVLRKAGLNDVRPVEPGRLGDAIGDEIARGASRVAVAGGDGTVAAAASAVSGTNTELAVIPAGTLNHFARDHGIPVDLWEACTVAQHGRVTCVDVGRVNGRLFLNTSSVGVYANYVRVRELHERRIGYWAASAWAMLRTFIRVRPFEVWFESGPIHRPYETPLVFVAVGERELKLPKLGRPVESGRRGLHVMVVRGRTRARWVALAFAAAARGIHATSRTPHLDSFVVQHCSIEQRHSTVAIDGEVVTLASPLEYELDVGGLRLVVPVDA